MSARLFEPCGGWQNLSPNVRTLQTTDEFSVQRIIVTNRISVELAKADGNRVHSWDAPDPSLNPEQLHQRRQTILMLTQALRRLPDGLREFVVQRHEQEIPFADAAKAMGITVAAAKSRLFRARRLLRRRLNMMKTDDSFVSCRF